MCLPAIAGDTSFLKSDSLVLHLLTIKMKLHTTIILSFEKEMHFKHRYDI